MALSGSLLERPFLGGTRQTVRAFALFGLTSLVLISIAIQLSFNELDLEQLEHSHRVGAAEAQAIAEAVTAIGREQGGVDFSRLRENIGVLRAFLAERVSQRSFVRFVEIRDRFGVPLLFVTRDPTTGATVAFNAPPPGSEEIWAGEPIVTAQLLGPEPEGEVRMGLEPDAFQRRLEALRRSLAIKVGIAGALGVLVFAVGLGYVLYLVRKNRRLEQSRLAAERRSYVGLLASGLAHEIRNPLNAMNMNLQMLEEEMQGVSVPGDGDHAELLESTKSEIKRLERLVNNFLTYARPAEPHFESKDLNATIKEVARFLQADFRQSAVELKLELEPLLPMVEIDETQFKQSLMNLLVNARQVLRKGGNVTVRSRAGAGGDVVVEIRDDGPGIPQEDRDKIFEVFFSSRGGGTGLGLPIARQIIERHGGRIQLDSRVGEGTTFEIHLPRRQGQAAPQAPPRGPVPA